MDTDIFDKYLNYKIKTICDYSIILSNIIGIDKNNFWHKKKDIEESVKWIVKDYMYNLDSNRNTENTIRLFIDDISILKYDIDNELVSTINYFININRAFEIKKYEKEIILIASIIYIANELDIATSPYKNNKNNYRTILNNYLAKFNKIPYFMLIDDSKKNTNLILEKIKENVKKERKIFNYLNSKTSFNKYIKIVKNDKYYLSQYNYSVQGLNKVDSKANDYVYENEKIADKLILISKDVIIITLMKLLSIRKLGKVFFLPIKNSFFEDESNINNLSETFKDNYLSKYIRVLIECKDYNKNIKNIVIKNNIDTFVYFDTNDNLVDNMKSIDKYLFSKDYAKKHFETIKTLIANNKEIIIENYCTIQFDYDLLEEEDIV